MTDRLGRLLIVDDETPVLDVLREYFEGQGYHVETANSGLDALAAIGRQVPDLVLLDMRMPGIDGLETLRRIHALSATLPVIMVTANEDVGLARETLKMGAFDYVAKPFDFTYLERAVSAGLVQSSPASIPDLPDEVDPWHELAMTVFRSVRRFPPAGRASTGERLETLVLSVARHATAGRVANAAEDLRALGLLTSLAGELGDLAPADRTTIENALQSAGKALPT
ncbi:MAG TPA: response regulator [Methylomirabilota bacterium]|jgi:DNA-binding response OmpR family regulator